MQRHITGTHVAYYHLCHRKLWLFTHGINMEQHSDLVAEGKLIGETSYSQRAARWQEISIDGIKIDHYDAKRGIVREIKKSSRNEAAHIAQVTYYLYVLSSHGMKVSHGLLEYPKERRTEEVFLEDDDLKLIPHWEEEIREIWELEQAPERLPRSKCRKCSYGEFCWV